MNLRQFGAHNASRPKTAFFGRAADNSGFLGAHGKPPGYEHLFITLSKITRGSIKKVFENG
jgi:hypothetical protein